MWCICSTIFKHTHRYPTRDDVCKYICTYIFERKKHAIVCNVNNGSDSVNHSFNLICAKIIMIIHETTFIKVS